MQFGGDVTASANAGVVLAAGAGSAPTLILAGSNNVQNINAANSMTLTLPALSISAGTVNVGNAAGYNGSVVFGGSTALTGASPVVNVNAGSLTVSSTLGGPAGANVQVNSGATLIGGPAGSIQIPLSVNSGGVLVPDASQASTPLVGSSLTIKGGGAFQWAYSGTGAEGTLVLGGNTLNLPSGNGHPIFRPQYQRGARAGHLCHDLEQPAGQRTVLDLRRFAPAEQCLLGIQRRQHLGRGHKLELRDPQRFAQLHGRRAAIGCPGLQHHAGHVLARCGAGVTIAPIAAANAVVAGPAEPVSLGALVIYGTNSHTASLTLSGSGSLSAASVSVLAGGVLADDGGAGSGGLTTPTLYLSGGSVTLGNAATSIGAATINSGGGRLTINGGSVASLSTSGGITIVGSAATLGGVTVGGGLVTLLNADSYSGPTNVSGGGVLRAGAANALSPNSDFYVGTIAPAGTLDLTGTPFPQTVNSLTIGTSGVVNVTIGVPLASLNDVTFGIGSTINIFGAIGSTPELLISYGGVSSGTISNVFDNGKSLPAGDLTDTGSSIVVAIASSTFSGSGTWIGATSSWNTNTNWTDGFNNGIPGDGTRRPGRGHGRLQRFGSHVGHAGHQPEHRGLEFQRHELYALRHRHPDVTAGHRGCGHFHRDGRRRHADDPDRRADCRRKSGRGHRQQRLAGDYRQHRGRQRP